MVTVKYFLTVWLLLTVVACSTAPAAQVDGVVMKVAETRDGYCHLKFPAIKKETLYWDRPVLTAWSEGDIIDFYGPCDHHPLGREEVLRQRRDLEFERHLGFDDE